jgi:hypothetical protein
MVMPWPKVSPAPPERGRAAGPSEDRQHVDRVVRGYSPSLPATLSDDRRRRQSRVTRRTIASSAGNRSDHGDHRCVAVRRDAERDDAGTPPRRPADALTTAEVGYDFLASVRF